MIGWIYVMNVWQKFWEWYDKHLTKSLFLTAVVIYMQIPHMVWAGDLFLETGIGLAHQNIVLDFFLYGIDLIEVFPMINLGFVIYSRLRKKYS